MRRCLRNCVADIGGHGLHGCWELRQKDCLRHGDHRTVNGLRLGERTGVVLQGLPSLGELR